MERITSFVLLLFAVIVVKAQYIEQLKVQLDTLERMVPGLKEPVDFTLVNAPMFDLLRGVAETHDLNVSLNDLPQIQITNNFTNVQVKDLFLFICQEYDLKIRFVNNIFAFYREERITIPDAMVHWHDQNQTVDFNLRNADLVEFAREFTNKTGYNLIINSTLNSQKASIFLKNVPVKHALQQLADIYDLELVEKKEKVFQLNKVIIQPETNNRTGRSQTNLRNTSRNSGFDLRTFKIDNEPYLSLYCANSGVPDLIGAICDELKIDYVFLTSIAGSMDGRLDSVRFDDFLDMALETSGLSFSVSTSGVYLIGTQNAGGLNESQVFTFLNRSVEGVTEIIPQDLMSQVQIKPFNDLNALIITGSDRATNKLINFLRQIDKPVANVLIEVIVMEVRKGYSLKTGIKAFLSDSTQATSGQVFGGVDATISSDAINKILSNLDDRGIMNLGQVTPRFYATLQAMEDNNNIEIKSTPKLSTINGHEATLQIGQSVYYLIETQNVTGGVNPIVTVTPRYENVEANLSIKITPFVSELEDVTLTIDAEFSDFIAPTVTGAPPGNATRKFISKIRIKNQETVVLGGLEEASDIESGSGVPILSRIPIIKWVFSSRLKDKSEGKLVILIKPTIVY
jgi:type IV pilus assembly protein PilQ